MRRYNRWIFLGIISAAPAFGDVMTANRDCNIATVDFIANTSRVQCAGLGYVSFGYDRERYPGLAERCHQAALRVLESPTVLKFRVHVSGRPGEGGYSSVVCEVSKR